MNAPNNPAIVPAEVLAIIGNMDGGFSNLQGASRALSMLIGDQDDGRREAGALVWLAGEVERLVAAVDRQHDALMKLVADANRSAAQEGGVA